MNPPVFKHILFPTDFSNTAHHAFSYALQLAEAMGARITLLHVYRHAQAHSSVVPEEFLRALDEEKIEKALNFFHEYQREAQLASGKSIEVHTLLEPGQAYDQIARLSRSGDYDLVVMGSGGAESEIRRAFGSVALRTLQDAGCPVLVVPAEAVFKPLRHITYCIGFEPRDFEVLHSLIDMAEYFNARVSCLHIRRTGGGWDKVDLALFDRLYKMESEEKRLEFFISNHEDFLTGLEDYVHSHAVDLVAMLTHRRFVMDAMYQESMTRKVALYSTVPLLVFHDKES